jgi:hypothetical protein
MRRPFALLIAAAALAGCGPTVTETFSDVGTALPVPTDASSPSASRSASGAVADEATIVLEGGAVADGPGESIADAIARASTDPTLVNGALLRDTDGTIWLCSSVDEDASPPECEEPRLVVANFPEGTADFDMESAELTGAQEADGVIWLEGHQLFGVVQP